MVGDKFGSEIWVLAHLYDRISSLKGYQGVITDLDETTKNIVIMDDCSYSGGNIASFIDGSTYKYAESILPKFNRPTKSSWGMTNSGIFSWDKFREDTDRINKRHKNHQMSLQDKQEEILKSINFYVMIPYAYKVAIDLIKDHTSVNKNVSIYVGEIIEPIKIDTTRDILKWLDNIHIPVYPDGTTRCLYFQHKVAIDMSTLYSVYVKGFCLFIKTYLNHVIFYQFYGDSCIFPSYFFV
jgi:hypothetical protein